MKDGTAHLKVVEIPSLKPTASKPEYASTSSTPGMTKLVVNVPEGDESSVVGQGTKELRKPGGYKMKAGGVIAGPYALPVKGSNGSTAMVKIVEGMWEDRLGKKVFGGERRRAETLHKLGVAEHRKAMGTAR